MNTPCDTTTRSFPAKSCDIEPPMPRFAQSASDALQCLLDLKTGMDRVMRVAHLVDDPVAQLVSRAADRQDWQHFIGRVTPFYWTEHTAALVSAAAQNYPLTEQEAVTVTLDHRTMTGSLDPSWIPPTYLPRRAAGLCVFRSPCLSIGIEGRTRPLSAIGWVVGVHAETHELRLSIRGVTWVAGAAAVTWWSDGGSTDAEDSQVDETFRDERLRFTRWICTAAMFIEQEIVTTSIVQADRGTRKRCARAFSTPPVCHVVSLRHEIEADHTAADHLTTVEWSHRWMVRGHWRRQFFPSRGGRAPIWIHPHVKGPTDKPFVDARPTVYAVRR